MRFNGGNGRAPTTRRSGSPPGTGTQPVDEATVDAEAEVATIDNMPSPFMPPSEPATQPRPPVQPQVASYYPSQQQQQPSQYPAQQQPSQYPAQQQPSQQQPSQQQPSQYPAHSSAPPRSEIPHTKPTVTHPRGAVQNPYHVAVSSIPPRSGTATSTPGEAPPWVPQVRPSARGVSVVVAVVAALTTAVSGFVAGWFLRPPELVSTPAPAKTEEIRAATSVSPTAAPAVEPTSAPAESAAPEPSASAVPEQSYEDVDAIEADVSKLLSYQGYLHIVSDTEAEVFVNGVNLGRTNETLVSRCFQKNVRLRDPKTKSWLTEGKTVSVDCMAVTRITIDP